MYAYFYVREIDERIINGIVKEKEVAKQEYEDAKEKGESAGHVTEG